MSLNNLTVQTSARNRNLPVQQLFRFVRSASRWEPFRRRRRLGRHRRQRSACRPTAKMTTLREWQLVFQLVAEAHKGEVKAADHCWNLSFILFCTDEFFMCNYRNAFYTVLCLKPRNFCRPTSNCNMLKVIHDFFSLEGPLNMWPIRDYDSP